MTLEQANAWLASRPAAFVQDLDAVRAVFAALGCAESPVHFVGISGTAGKTAVAHMEAAILNEAGFLTGLYTAGAGPLRARLEIGGKPVEARLYTRFAEKLAACPAAERLPRSAAELAVACACFTAAECMFAAVEFSDTLLAQLLPSMPVCAVTQIGDDGSGRSLERVAYSAASILRRDCTAVTTPSQPKAALQEIIVAAGKADCELTVPEAEDLEQLAGRRLENHMDYGGYTVVLPQLGRPASENAAVAVELALALWRKGFDIPDEPILAGLPAAPAGCGVHLLRRRPNILAAPCRLPIQAAALAALLREEGFSHLSVVAGLSSCPDAEAFFKALETGFIPEEDKTEKNQMAGMSDNPVEKVYLVTPEGENALDAQAAEQAARFHFETEVCADLASALAAARDGGDGIVILGGAEICRQAERLLNGKKK